MPRKTNRSYKKGAPHRDARLIIIATEGAKREKEYFEFLVHGNQRVKVRVLAPTDEDEGKSAPRWVMNRAAKYVDKFGLSEEDQLWLVIDLDKWALDQVHEIAQECVERKGWNIAISNPCFEVWLFLHYATINKTESQTCSQLKTGLGNIIKGGYNLGAIAHRINLAIDRARASDSNKAHFLPNPMETKAYLLVEQLVRFIS
ncbi:MAG: RloB family protein [Bacteroidota bacterium]